MAGKITILLPVEYYQPAFRAGGPVRTLAGIVEHLGKEFDFKIITRNWDLGETQPFAATQPDRWNLVGNALVFYLSPPNCNGKRLRALVNETPHHLMYLNSFWSGLFSVSLLWARRFQRIEQKPVLMAPRGELAPEALSHKKIKKTLYLHASRCLRLCQGISWQGSNAQETSQIRAFIEKWIDSAPQSAIHTAIDLRPAPDCVIRAKTGKHPGFLRLVFLARIHPIKQLDLALKILGQVKGDVYFGIYGPIEPGSEAYWEKCRGLIRSLPANVTAEYKGTLAAAQVVEELHGYHAFLMPSKTENYGHSIAEALEAGCPVVISDQTPWRHLAEKGVGWDLPLHQPDLFVEALQKLVDMEDRKYQERSVACREYAGTATNSPEVIAVYRQMFLQAAGASGSRSH